MKGNKLYRTGQGQKSFAICLSLIIYTNQNGIKYTTFCEEAAGNDSKAQNRLVADAFWDIGMIFG